MTKDEFIEAYCKRSGVTWEQLSKKQEALPCACGDESCVGWAMVSLDLVDDHMRLYAPETI